MLIDVQSNKIKSLTSRAIVHGGPLIAPACSDDVLRCLFAEAISLVRATPAVYLEIRPYFDYSPYDELFRRSGFEYIDYCDCHADTSSLEVIDHNIQPRKLTKIRSALRQGIDFVDNPTDGQIAEFYALLKTNHWRRTRRPMPSLRYFLDLVHFRIGSILLAYHRGTLISGCVTIKSVANGQWPVANSQFYYYVAGRDREYPHLAPSSVITYHFLQNAYKEGSQHTSFMGAGRLSIPYGVRDFKVRMGGMVVPVGRYIHVFHPLIYRLASFALNLLHKSNT